MMFHWLARLYHKKRASFPSSLKLANSKEERGTLSCVARLYHKKRLLEISALANTEKGGTPTIAEVSIPHAPLPEGRF